VQLRPPAIAGPRIKYEDDPATHCDAGSIRGTGK